MRMHANNVVCWSNDIQSLIVEIEQPGQFRNMVTLHIHDGLTLNEAIDTTARRIRAEIAAFSQLAEMVQRKATPPLRGFVRGMQHWMRGYQEWVEHDTHRYDPRHASQDADDRGIGP